MYLLIDFFLPLLVFTLCGGNETEPEPGALTPTYIWRDDVTGVSFTCDKCPPGTYLRMRCTKDSKTECEPCPKSHYTEIWNYIERCQYCNIFCTDDQFVSVQCTQFHNRKCECKDGFYMRHGSCSRHSRCLPGEGVLSNGTAYTDVTCEPCRGGFFSADSSSRKSCQKFTVCTPDRTTIPGDDRHDVYCSACKSGSMTQEDEAICDGELMEFLGLQILTSRKHKRLMTVLRRSAGKNFTEKSTVLDLLTTIKNKPSNNKPFANRMHDILDTDGLLHLRRKVNKWFPHMTL
ncbi:tumor necrosis factor receptor superfamily member 6B [Oncorhynchus kisutch]|uniref:Tumor necrosis factor receptor superfamily member 6B n=1 Tax=Oncorhynchus kisutch TaxID=8019 RepID=A0A8C7J7Q4_ONCKI|nr:tumor necrosis factor receptor superfamily member 6B [Oncorhynchus kisutch]